MRVVVHRVPRLEKLVTDDGKVAREVATHRQYSPYTVTIAEINVNTVEHNQEGGRWTHGELLPVLPRLKSTVFIAYVLPPN